MFKRWLTVFALAVLPLAVPSQAPPELSEPIDQSIFHFSNRKDGQVTIDGLRIGVSGRYLMYVSVQVTNHGKYPITYLALSVDGLKIEQGCPSAEGPNIPWDCRMHFTVLTWGDKASFDLGKAVKDPLDEIRPGETRTLEFKADKEPFTFIPQTHGVWFTVFSAGYTTGDRY